MHKSICSQKCSPWQTEEEVTRLRGKTAQTLTWFNSNLADKRVALHHQKQNTLSVKYARSHWPTLKAWNAVRWSTVIGYHASGHGILCWVLTLGGRQGGTGRGVRGWWGGGVCRWRDGPCARHWRSITVGRRSRWRLAHAAYQVCEPRHWVWTTQDGGVGNSGGGGMWKSRLETVETSGRIKVWRNEGITLGMCFSVITISESFYCRVLNIAGYHCIFWHKVVQLYRKLVLVAFVLHTTHCRMTRGGQAGFSSQTMVMV